MFSCAICVVFGKGEEAVQEKSLSTLFLLLPPSFIPPSPSSFLLMEHNLVDTAENGGVEVEALLRNNLSLDVNYFDWNGWTTLHHAQTKAMSKLSSCFWPTLPLMSTH